MHFEIHATDPEKVIAFYTDVFGWRFERWGEEPYWLASTGDGPGIDGAVLPRRGDPPATGQPVNAFVVTVGVENLDAALERAAAHGAVVALPRQPVPGVGWLAYLLDPDGNLVGVMEPDPETPAPEPPG
jgi:hypothetical protein